jgi:hypothetical protein
MDFVSRKVRVINSCMIVIIVLCGVRNSVRLAIRKLTYAPEEPAPQPSAEAVKDFMMSPGSIRLEASLDKEVRMNE